ncbi:putative uncharacterized protein DDB_G0286901 [Oppia nitens]|uniref:putative uncharacterized protein DDB_G0286901 n=1 Tax=Oppia nitens TaxID=1686743 RepID=UPI0023D97CDD|nr:putative uncharacterized protein DDB_G0286901 [Oppia nitens]
MVERLIFRDRCTTGTGGYGFLTNASCVLETTRQDLLGKRKEKLVDNLIVNSATASSASVDGNGSCTGGNARNNSGTGAADGLTNGDITFRRQLNNISPSSQSLTHGSGAGVSQQTQSTICLKSGKTSIGSPSSPTKQQLLVKHSSLSSPVGCSGAYSESSQQICLSCQCCCCQCQRDDDDSPSHWGSDTGFTIDKTKAVHLNSNPSSSTNSGANVPIVRSVSSLAVVTGRPCSQCLVSTCADCCLKNFKTTDCSSNDLSNKTNQINAIQHKCYNNTSRVKDSTSEEQQIIPGFVAQRKSEFLQRQVSEPVLSGGGNHHLIFNHHHQQNDSNTYVQQIDDHQQQQRCHQQLLDKDNKMINRDNKSDIINNKDMYNQYEVIMNSVNNSNTNNRFDRQQVVSHHMNGNTSDGNSDDSEYELQYGPGIVDRLKHKFMSISIQQQNLNRCVFHTNKLKRFSSLECISVSNDLANYTSRESPKQSRCQHIPNGLKLSSKGSNDLVAINGGTRLSYMDGGGNTVNGTQLQHNNNSHRLYVQNHNHKNLYNSRSMATVPVIKRAKSMETLVMQSLSDHQMNTTDRSRQPVNNCLSPTNQLLSLSPETPLSNQTNDLLFPLNDSTVVVIENSCAESSDKSHTNNNNNSANIQMNSQSSSAADIMKSVSHNKGLIDELPKPDTVKTYKKLFEPKNSEKTSEDTNNGKTTTTSTTTTSPAVNTNKLKNYKKSQMTNGSNGTNTSNTSTTSTTTTTSSGSIGSNVKRKPPVLRATTRSAQLKTQTSTLSSSNDSQPINKSQSSLPQVIQSIPSPTKRITNTNTNLTTTTPTMNGMNDKNNNNSHKSANNSSAVVTPPLRKPPIAPKRPSLTQKAITDNQTSVNNVGLTNEPIDEIDSNDDKQSCVPMMINGSADSSSSASAADCSSNNQTNQIVNQESNATSPPLNSVDNNSLVVNSSNKSKVNKPIANIKPFTQLNNNNQNDDYLTVGRINNERQTNDNEEHIINNICRNGYGKVNEQTLSSTKVSNEDNNQKVDEKQQQSIAVVNNNSNINNNKNNVSPNSSCDTTQQLKTKQTNNTSITSHTIPDNNHHLMDQTVDVLKPSILLNSENNSTNSSTKSPIISSSLWSPESVTKKSVNSSTTSIVFDFRGKDVKSNIAIQPAPFGTTAAKRSTNGRNNSSVNDSDNDDDNYNGSTEIGPPSGIVFTGENVRVGKGSLLVKRNKKLSLHFNDSLTKTFEYQSEQSFLEEEEMGISTAAATDEFIVNGNNGINGSKSETQSVINNGESNNNNNNGIQLNSSLKTVKNNLALGGSQGSLGSYKPTLIETPFELGVSRTNHKSTPKTTGDSTTDNNGSGGSDVNNSSSANNNSYETDLIKPANPEETSSWSTSSTASDLLF